MKLGLGDGFPILETLRIFIKPIDRHGQLIGLDPFFTKLTGITNEQIADHGVPLADALDETDRFSSGAQFWSWGKDELNMMAISCYIAGIAPVIPASRFENACNLLLAAGMPYDDLKKTRSTSLAAYYGVELPEAQDHDALSDALSVTHVLRHLLNDGALNAQAFKA